MMLELQARGHHNVNWVPPEHEEYLRAVEVSHDLGLRRDTRFGMAQRQ
jgi:hypothetical protein